MKVLLVHSGSTEQELKQAREWLETESCQVAVFDANASATNTRSASLTALIAECDVVVFLVDAQISVDEVQLAVIAAHSKGKEVVAVHLGAKISLEVFEKYGSASVPFKQNLVVGAVCAHDPAWVNEDGTPRDDQDMDHHKCKTQNPKASDAVA